LATHSFGDGIANQTTAFIELAAGSLSWILVNRDEGCTNDYTEDLFESVRSRTLAHMAGNARATLEALHGMRNPDNSAKSQ
jgi:hypothetical protein